MDSLSFTIKLHFTYFSYFRGEKHPKAELLNINLMVFQNSLIGSNDKDDKY